MWFGDLLLPEAEDDPWFGIILVTDNWWDDRVVECAGLVHPRRISLGLKNLDGENWMYYVYILLSTKQGKLYKGFTNDLRSRIARHNSGKVKSSRDGCPWKLVYYEAFVNKTDALREEKFLKSGKGRERIEYLLKNTLD